MSNELTIFNNPEFGQVRTLLKEGKVFFCAHDVAKSLGYQNVSKAIKDNCKEKGITDGYTLTEGGTQRLIFIDDGNVYRLCARSQLPSAEKFESWVFDEVLPSIHKHGAYLTPETAEQVLFNPDLIIKLALQIKEERAAKECLQLQAIKDKPKVLFAEAVETSNTSILIGDLAKLIRQNGVEMGQNRLFAWLRDNDFLIKYGQSKNMPTQRAMESGLFEVKERTLNNPNGSTFITRTTMVSGRGQVFFINKFLKNATAQIVH